MNKTLIYLFDPLCGWCYGAGGALPKVIEQTGLQVKLMPTGLFSGAGSRVMDAEFSAYAWANDQRIERLTGQVFTEAYRRQVLSAYGQAFDSGPATVALTAVSLTAPEQELAALKVIQRARYVDGLDITRLDTLSTLLDGLGLIEAAKRLNKPDESLLGATQYRVEQAQGLLQRFAAQGVPTFILDDGKDARLLHASAIFSNPQAFVREVMGAA